MNEQFYHFGIVSHTHSSDVTTWCRDQIKPDPINGCVWKWGAHLDCDFKKEHIWLTTSMFIQTWLFFRLNCTMLPRYQRSMNNVRPAVHKGHWLVKLSNPRFSKQYFPTEKKQMWGCFFRRHPKTTTSFANCMFRRCCFVVVGICPKGMIETTDVQWPTKGKHLLPTQKYASNVNTCTLR